MGVWVEALLVIIILLLLGIILFSGGGIVRRRKLSGEVDFLRKEVKRLLDANEALRGSLGIGAERRVKRFGDLLGLVRDLEGLRCAIAGSSSCQLVLTQKYGAAPGPELLKRILAARPEMNSATKQRLADELLVGEVGRGILRNLDTGVPLERAASDVGVPVMVARGQVRRLQTLGYLDARMRLTDRGREALV